MLRELEPHLSPSKKSDLVNRLESKRPNQNMPAEMEIALLWVASKSGDIEIEPEWLGTANLPDVYSEKLVPGHAIVIEITSLTDNSLSGTETMDAITRHIGSFVERHRRGAIKHLYYRFGERRGFDRNGYFRKRLAPTKYKLSAASQSLIARWINGGARQPIQIIESGLAVLISLETRQFGRYSNFHCAMPPETHSLENNPLFDALHRKLDQLRGIPTHIIRVIALFDRGSTLLRRVGPGDRDYQQHRKTGSEIINHFLFKYSAYIDGIAIISAQRQRLHDRHPSWGTHVFARRYASELERCFADITKALPRPIMDSHQLGWLSLPENFPRSQKQLYFATQYGREATGQLYAKISARALLDLLAGKIDAAAFRSHILGPSSKPNIFDLWLTRGLSICDVGMAAPYTDDQDDHITLMFCADPTVTPGNK